MLASEIKYKEGVNSTKFQENIDEFQCKHETYINVILTPAGTIDFFDIGYPVPSNYKQYTDSSEISLGIGIYRLVRALLILQGTIIAIDLNYYQNAIEKQLVAKIKQIKESNMKSYPSINTLLPLAGVRVKP